MIIECSGCDARFRMKESMLEGFRGAQVRCRRCGGTIVIEMPAPRTQRRTAPTEAHTISSTAPAKADTRPRTVSAETSARSGKAPDNVYPIERFRQSAARKPSAKNFDISGLLRPEPEGGPDVRIAAAAPFPLPMPQEPAQERVRASHLEEPLPVPALGIAPPADKPVRKPPFRRWFGIRRRSRGSAGASWPGFPRAWHIAIVYLFLLFLGGFAFLIVEFFLSSGGFIFH